MNDSTVTTIVFDIDSPGGSVAGIPEAANEIYASRGPKRIVAVANPTIASAAYWIACAADEIVCMSSGMVGSIGVLTVHVDRSEANKMLGKKPTYVTYGQYKAETNSDTPLSEDARGYMQEQVNQMGDMFTKFVAKGRGVPVETVRKSFGQGRMLMAKDAQAVGMVDSIGTIEQTVARLARAKVGMGAMGVGRNLNATLTAETDTTATSTKSCTCACADGCACGGGNDTCCGSSDCDCCTDMEAKAAIDTSDIQATEELQVSESTSEEATPEQLVSEDTTAGHSASVSVDHDYALALERERLRYLTLTIH